MIKTLRKLGIEPNFLTMSKSIDKNPTAGIILHGKRLTSFLLRSEKEERYCFHHCYSTLYWNV